MFGYAHDICKLAHNIIASFATHHETALDATLGNGNDTAFLMARFRSVYAFDVQEQALAPWRERAIPGLTLIHDSHAHLMRHINEPLDCIMYNLGYLPGSDKRITTRAESTVSSLKQALGLLRPGGLLTMVVYVSHPGGREEAEAVLALTEALEPEHFGVILHKLHNRSERAPFLLVVEKNSGPGSLTIT